VRASNFPRDKIKRKTERKRGTRRERENKKERILKTQTKEKDKYRKRII
jgi:hypothetical protein